MRTTIESAGPRSAKSSRVLEENPPNARRTMEALRELGYDSYASILDIIDNCIDAHAVKIDIEIGEQKGDIVITIADDGMGMVARSDSPSRMARARERSRDVRPPRSSNRSRAASASSACPAATDAQARLGSSINGTKAYSERW